MRLVRYLLQAVILVLGGFVLYVLARSGRDDWAALAVMAGFFGFLFVMTLWLREQTESRLTGRAASHKAFAVFIGSLGIACVPMAYDIATAGYSGSSSRRGALLRMSIEAFGPWPAALFFAVFGFSLIRVALIVWRRPSQ